MSCMAYTEEIQSSVCALWKLFEGDYFTLIAANHFVELASTIRGQLKFDCDVKFEEYGMHALQWSNLLQTPPGEI